MSGLPEEVRLVLGEARTIAVLGAHDAEHKPAFYVPDYLRRQGYRILPVNPTLGRDELWGEPLRDHLGEIEEPVDVVDVFRRSELLPAHLDDLLAMAPRPRWVWFQLGVRNDSVARRLEEHGIGVIQDRCLLADHRAWTRSPPG